MGPNNIVNNNPISLLISFQITNLSLSLNKKKKMVSQFFKETNLHLVCYTSFVFIRELDTQKLEITENFKANRQSEK